MSVVEDFNEEDKTDYELYAGTLNYSFDPRQYETRSAAERGIEEDKVLAAEIKRYYPELRGWEVVPLARAWRCYSKDVCSIDEEYVCVRTPDFLAYLYIVQENLDISEKSWLSAVQEAVNILWPGAIQKDIIDEANYPTGNKE